MDSIAASTSHHSTIYEIEIDAINMQLQEIQTRRGIEKQKYREGRIPDHEMALRDFENELTTLLMSFRDQIFASSLQKAIDDDFVTLDEAATEEAQAQRDRAMALSISNGNVEAEKSECAEGPNRDRECNSAFGRISATYVASDCSIDNSAGLSASSSWTHHKTIEHPSSHLVNCISCRDSFRPFELIRCPCEDLYCAGCLKSLFIRSMKDETLFPPRCCGTKIPLSMVESELSDKELSSFKAATIEFTTFDRTYCAQMDCGRFIPPGPTHSGHVICLFCNAETCIYCKMLSHGGDCPEDKELLAVLALAEGQRWRRCFKCKTMVELNVGCNHITCKCAAEFCYTCGVQWKNCTCDVWEERNLLNRAEQVVDREANRPMAPPEREHRVVEMRRELRANHECNHPGRWERQTGHYREGFKCEICDAQHWKYILRCRRCHLVACQECRRHRI